MALFVLLAVFFASVMAVPQMGSWTFNLDKSSGESFANRLMYKGSKITLSVMVSCDKNFEIEWVLFMSPCALSFTAAGNFSNSRIEEIYPGASRYVVPKAGLQGLQMMHNVSRHSCSDADAGLKIEGYPGQKPEIIFPIPQMSGTAAGGDQQAVKENVTSAADQVALVAEISSANASNSTLGLANQSATNQQQRQQRAANVKPVPAVPKEDKNEAVVATTWADGNYFFIFKLNVEGSFNAKGTLEMYYGNHNYLSAGDYPLLIFYGVMGLVYIIYGVLWLVLLACNWRDLLRVQFWISGVILLGMLEKAVFFAEYENVNKTGVTSKGVIIFATLVSCLKRTLARILVIIVSMGFGIVRPRLGQALHKVLFVGGLYFLLAAIEGYMRAATDSSEQSNEAVFAAVPLAVLEAIICWWIFSSLIQTTRTLRLRRNVVKLSLYRHFTNTLIFAVLASVAYMVWFLTQHRFNECIKDWKQLWVDEAFWHMLFVVLLLIIILLWRPTANNLRYAFSPLLDAADEEDEDDAVMNDAFEGMKMRGTKAANGSPKQWDPHSKAEDDLKWVEENIPSSVADKALPALLDSDEELMNTRFEMSKMD